MIQLQCEAPGVQVDEVSEYLTEAGANAVAITPLSNETLLISHDETPMWSQTCLCAYFEQSNIPENLLEDLLTTFGLQGKLSETSDFDWETNYRQHFKPTQFGTRLWVYPAWETPPASLKTVVRLAPGMAFGTGTHPTTAMCLRWLDDLITPETTVIDYGCGSGILGIAAAKLGATTVIGTDVDPQALIASRENAALNSLTLETINFFEPDDTPALKADYIVANILANPLKILAPNLQIHLKPTGKIALTGILEHQAQGVIDAYSPLKLKIQAQTGEWVLLSN